MKYGLVIDSNLNVSVRGVDMGPIEVHQMRPDTLVLKKAGHKYWSGRQQQSYSPAAFIVMVPFDQAEKFPTSIEPDQYLYIQAREVVRFPVR